MMVQTNQQMKSTMRIWHSPVLVRDCEINLNITMSKFWSSSHMNSARLYTVLGFIMLGILSRLLPHPPSFTAINAIALFGICSLGSIRISLFTVYSSMLFSDLVFGWHSSMIFVYLSLGLIVLMGHWLNSKSSMRTAFLLIASSFLFFFITNFGLWIVSPIYPKTFAGLGLCYLAAIPFLANSMMSTLIYGAILFRLSAFSIHNRTVSGGTQHAVVRKDSTGFGKCQS